MQENFGKKIVKGQNKYVKHYYAIKNEMNNKVIDLRYDEKQKDTKDVAFCWAPDSGKGQNFTFVKQGFDFYIKNKNESHYLTVESQENGSRIYGAPKQKGNKHQIFRIQKKDNGDVIFIRTFCDKVLQVPNEGKDCRIQQWKFSGNENQQFKLLQPRALDSSTDEGESLYETKQGLSEVPGS